MTQRRTVGRIDLLPIAGGPVAVIAPFIILSMLMAFGLSATAVVLLLARRRPKPLAADDPMVQLRDEMRELRDSMEARFADITLMLDDMDKRQLPPRAGGD